VRPGGVSTIVTKKNGGPSWVSGRAGRCLDLGEGEGFYIRRVFFRETYLVSAKEQREALRKAFGLPHYNGDYADYLRHICGK